MILINFSHPITPEQLAQIESLAGERVARVIDLPADFDNQESFVPQLAALLDRLPLTSRELQTQPLLINPPAYNFITAVLLAELHGRLGYFPSVVRLRPVPGSAAPAFEAAEILNLQSIRHSARRRRAGEPPAG
jgi:hypothetical protein